MKICKTRFRLLGVLGASMSLVAVMTGCSSKTPDTAAPQNVDGRVPPAEAGSSGASGSSGTSGTSSSSSSSSSSSGASGTSGSSGADGGADAKADAPAPVDCLDDKAPLAQPACPTAGAGDECTQSCDELALNYKKGVSADIRKCLTAAICQASTATCTDKSIAKSCVDATATAFCTPLVTGCKGANAAETITQASCELIAKSMTTVGRAALQNCFETEAVCGDCPAKLK